MATEQNVDVSQIANAERSRLEQAQKERAREEGYHRMRVDIYRLLWQELEPAEDGLRSFITPNPMLFMVDYMAKHGFLDGEAYRRGVAISSSRNRSLDEQLAVTRVTDILGAIADYFPRRMRHWLKCELQPAYSSESLQQYRITLRSDPDSLDQMWRPDMTGSLLAGNAPEKVDQGVELTADQAYAFLLQQSIWNGPECISAYPEQQLEKKYGSRIDAEGLVDEIVELGLGGWRDPSKKGTDAGRLFLRRSREAAPLASLDESVPDPLPETIPVAPLSLGSLRAQFLAERERVQQQLVAEQAESADLTEKIRRLEEELLNLKTTRDTSVSRVGEVERQLVQLDRDLSSLDQLEREELALAARKEALLNRIKLPTVR